MKKSSKISLSEADSFCSAQLYESDFDSDIEKISQETENELWTLVRTGEESNSRNMVAHNPLHAK